MVKELDYNEKKNFVCLNLHNGIAGNQQQSVDDNFSIKLGNRKN